MTFDKDKLVKELMKNRMKIILVNTSTKTSTTSTTTEIVEGQQSAECSESFPGTEERRDKVMTEYFIKCLG